MYITLTGTFVVTGPAGLVLSHQLKIKMMAPQIKTSQDRQYDIDWLRILLILSVFLFHVGMIFNTWYWHVKNDVQIKELRYLMSFLHYWRIPLLFLVSGVGTWLALGKRTPGQYLAERFNRLIIPFIAGIFILVPVQVYIEKSAQYGSLLDFYPHMFDGIYPTGNFSWHHLYFILYLFIVALIITPFLGWFRSNSFIQYRDRLLGLLSRPMAMNIILVPLFLTQVLLRPYFPQETHALFNDWAAFSFYLVFFLAGLVLVSNNRLRDAIMKQRRLYLVETVASTAFMFSTPHLFVEGATIDLTWDIASIFVAWSCSMTAIGYCRRYLNRDSKFRKLANEAIYPFYLLHQPAIVVVGYYVVAWHIPLLLKALIITVLSFVIIILLYWFLIRRVNFLRVIFGLKIRPKMVRQEEGSGLQPVMVSSSLNR